MSSSYNLLSFLQLIYRYRFSSTNVCVGYNTGSNKSQHGYQGLHIIRPHDSTATVSKDNLHTNIVKANDNTVKPRPTTPDPPRPNFSAWAKWMLGSILSIILPFWSQKWLAVKKIEGEVEIGLEAAEKVAAAVEKVSTLAENASSQLAENLPDNAKIKQAAVLIQDLSKATAHDAHLTNNFIHKVDDLMHDVEDLETMVEPVIEKLLKQKPGSHVK
ncbi:uncharacterized protein [Euphorbia lathyris]|uniref:uncharacterized protein n=1 Tax=Euphorbia lathyris TaxID=212925 RepID=UPI0033133EF0